MVAECYACLGTFYEGKSLLEKYYWQSGLGLASYFNYHPLLSIIYTISSKMCTYAWNYSDILLIILCLQICKMVRTFESYIAGQVKLDKTGGICWSQIKTNFLSLCDVAENVTDFVAPLAIFCYGVNIFYMITNVLFVLYGKLTVERSAYHYASFIQFTLRVILVTYAASEVHHSTQSISKTLDRCPDVVFTASVISLFFSSPRKSIQNHLMYLFI